MPDPHVDGGNGVKTIVYNMKKIQGKGDKKKRKDWKKEIERESKRLKNYNSKKEEFSTLSHSTKSCTRILSAYVCV